MFAFRFHRSRVGLASAAMATLLSSAHAALSLPALYVDTTQTSVSGYSAGGIMTVQLHVAYSSVFKKGAGVGAGLPYSCAFQSAKQQGEQFPFLRCQRPGYVYNVDAMKQNTTDFFNQRLIDDPANLANTKLYLYSSQHDTVVPTAGSDATLEYYKKLGVKPENIVYNKSLQAVHSFPTVGFGNPCDPNPTGAAVMSPPYIINCNFNLAQAFLTQIYGSLNPPATGPLPGSLVEFDQMEFFNGATPNSISMASTGWAYVPTACSAGSQCRLHVVIHGCLNSTWQIGRQFIEKGGYNELAESNNIIMLYPQAAQKLGNRVPDTNACYDWTTYTNTFFTPTNRYLTKNAPQMAAIVRMVTKLSSGAVPLTSPPPSGVTATASNTTANVTVSWTSLGTGFRYNVYRYGAKVNGNTPLAVGTTMYSGDTGLDTGTTYQYTVRGVNASGAETRSSSVATAKTVGSAPICIYGLNPALFSGGQMRHDPASRIDAYTAEGTIVNVFYDETRNGNEYVGHESDFFSSAVKSTDGGANWRIGTCR